MRKSTIVLIIGTVFFLITCTPAEKSVDVKQYISPDLKNHTSLLYEYENSNYDLYPLKYLQIKKDDSDPDRYSYLFLDKDFSVVSGAIEKRNETYADFEELIIVELDQDQNAQINSIKTEDWIFPYSLPLNKVYNFNTTYTSPIDKSVYSMSSDRQLVEVLEAYTFKDTTCAALLFTNDEIFEVKIESDPFLHTAQYQSDLIYAQNIGLIAMKITFANNQKADLKLTQIFHDFNIDNLTPPTNNK